MCLNKYLETQCAVVPTTQDAAVDVPGCYIGYELAVELRTRCPAEIEPGTICTDPTMAGALRASLGLRFVDKFLLEDRGVVVGTLPAHLAECIGPHHTVAKL